MRRSILVLAVVIAASAVCFAGGAAYAPTCTIAGTWYGGSADVPFPYFSLKITPAGIDRYSIEGEYAGDIRAGGGVAATEYKGELWRKHANVYMGVEFSEWIWDPTSPNVPPGVDPLLPELDVLHMTGVELVDCNTLSITWDHFFIYENFTYETTPLLTPPAPPGFDAGGGTETYHRLPLKCPACSAVTSMTIMQPDMSMLNRRKPPKK